MDRIHEVYIAECKTSFWMSAAREAAYTNSTTRPDDCGLKCGPACRKQLRKRRSIHGLLKKPKLDNARRLRGTYFIDREDGEYKETSKKRKEKVGDTDGGG